MNWQELKKRMMPLGRKSSTSFTLPSIVLELEPDFVAGARLNGGAHRVERMGVREVPPGCLSPFLHRPNMINAEAVRKAVEEVVNTVGNGGSRWGLLLPDAAARVGTLRFETLPDDRREAEALIRWRMRASLPFPSEEARVCFQVTQRAAEGVELLALAVRGSVLAEYEATLEGIDGGPCLILPASVALLPLLPEEDDANQLLFHVCSGAVTSLVVSGSRVRFWRSRLVGGENPAETAREVAREVGRTLATMQDHEKIELDRVWVCMRPPATAECTEQISRLAGREVRVLPEDAETAATLSSSEQELFKSYGPTFAGLLANGGKER